MRKRVISGASMCLTLWCTLSSQVPCSLHSTSALSAGCSAHTGWLAAGLSRSQQLLGKAWQPSDAPGESPKEAGAWQSQQIQQAGILMATFHIHSPMVGRVRTAAVRKATQLRFIMLQAPAPCCRFQEEGQGLLGGG